MNEINATVLIEIALLTSGYLIYVVSFITFETKIQLMKKIIAFIVLFFSVVSFAQKSPVTASVVKDIEKKQEQILTELKKNDRNAALKLVVELRADVHRLYESASITFAEKKEKLKIAEAAYLASGKTEKLIRLQYGDKDIEKSLEDTIKNLNSLKD